MLRSKCKIQNGQVIFYFFPQKPAENDSTECIELFCAKNRLQKHQNGQVIFNFFFAKTCWKWFYGMYRVVLCKKLRAKTLNSRDMKAFSRSSILVSLEPMQNGQVIFNFFFRKNMLKWFYGMYRVVLCKKPLAKTPNSWDMRAIWRSSIFVSP